MVELYLFNIIKENSLLKAAKEKTIRIEVSGHAGFDKKNKDIVCAAISAIIQTAVLSINRVCGLKQKVKQESGYLESVIKIHLLSDSKVNDLMIVLNTMLTGLEEIKRIYPDSISITIGIYKR